jgi:hypothetical protein
VEMRRKSPIDVRGRENNDSEKENKHHAGAIKKLCIKSRNIGNAVQKKSINIQHGKEMAKNDIAISFPLELVFELFHVNAKKSRGFLRQLL